MTNIRLMTLPYDHSALQPVISARTLDLHHGKHHKGYVDKLNRLIPGTPYEHLSVEEIVKRAATDKSARKIFNNAGQVWNHDFFWLSMTPGGGGQPSEGLKERIENDFTSFEKFAALLVKTGAEHFGSGWVWLCAGPEGGLKVVATHDADSPILDGQRPLLCCDLWEHAYYLDYQNDRESFVRGFLRHLANWSYAAERYQQKAAAE